MLSRLAVMTVGFMQGHVLKLVTKIKLVLRTLPHNATNKDWFDCALC
jgi:hypothetical protein